MQQFMLRKFNRLTVDLELLLLETVMPWVDREHHAAAAESNSSSYRTSARLNTYTHNAVDISTDEEIISVDTEDEKDEAYSPVDGGWISKASDDSETYVDSDEVHNEAAEEEGMSVDDGQNAVEDLVHNDLEDTQSEEDIMEDKKRSVFCADPSGCVRLEVGQFFQNLHHFRQVICNFTVQEGFQLRRIKNERDRYTTECAYDGCGWRIHASPIDNRRTFMIKTMEAQHSCQKVHKNQEANAVWVVRRAKRRVLEKTEVLNYKSYSLLHTYDTIVIEKNPGFMVKIEDSNRFSERLYATAGAGCMSLEGGISSKHAMAVIRTKILNLHVYVHKYLTKEYYLKTYRLELAIKMRGKRYTQKLKWTCNYSIFY
ncbi:hypothetical protein ACOSQ2_014338 [Xanthoceras sorbifolium]